MEMENFKQVIHFFLYAINDYRLNNLQKENFEFRVTLINTKFRKFSNSFFSGIFYQTFKITKKVKKNLFFLITF